MFPFPNYGAAGKGLNYECENHDGVCPRSDVCVFSSRAAIRVILIAQLLCYHHQHHFFKCFVVTVLFVRGFKVV